MMEILKHNSLEFAFDSLKEKNFNLLFHSQKIISLRLWINQLRSVYII